MVHGVLIKGGYCIFVLGINILPLFSMHSIPTFFTGDIQRAYKVFCGSSAPWTVPTYYLTSFHESTLPPTPPLYNDLTFYMSLGRG